MGFIGRRPCFGLEFIGAGGQLLIQVNVALDCPPWRPSNPFCVGTLMFDALLIAAGVAFFALAVLYCVACDRI